MPSFTFVASFEAVLSVGAVPVIVDIDKTLTLDPDAVRKAITPATKCIMPVHMCGSMADLDAIRAICREYKLLLLEDACQSIGASYHGKSLGSIGDAGAFSFDFVKTITCAEGGAVLTNNKTTYKNCDGYSDHGHDHLGSDRGADLHPFPGYNFRISELHAAVGLAQFRKLDKFLALQKKNHQYLQAALSAIPVARPGSLVMLRFDGEYATPSVALPIQVQYAVNAANYLQHKPYVLGGGHRSIEDSAYDPRRRPWYNTARTRDGPVSVGPYATASTRSLAVTLAMPMQKDSSVVVGVDVLLQTVSRLLAREMVSGNARGYVFDNHQQLIVHSDPAEMERLRAA